MSEIFEYYSSNPKSVAFLRNQNNKFLIFDYKKKYGELNNINKNNFYNYYSHFDINFYKTTYNLYDKSEIEILNHYHNIGVKQKLLYNDKIKIIIYTPSFDENCGGICVLYNLAKTINSLKHPKIYAQVCVYDNTKITNEFCQDFLNPQQIDDNTVVIYPESILGNPLDCKNVIRWILLELGLDMPTTQYQYWGKNDLVYHWETSRQKKSKQLVNIWIDNRIKRYNYSNKRQQKCYGLKKMQWIPHNLHSKFEFYHSNNDTKIDGKTTEEIIDIFNESSIFYCYDPNTFYTIMAPLCGCITILHPIYGISKQEYFSSRILCNNDNYCYTAGIAYGNTPEEIYSAQKNIDEAQEQFDILNKSYQHTVSEFISDIDKLVSGQQLKNTVSNIYY